MKMRHILFLTLGIATVGCGGGSKTEEGKTSQETAVQQTEQQAGSEQVSKFGVGPIQKPLNLPETIDEALAKKGEELFDSKGCTACHELDKVKVGPALRFVADSVPPEWIMNMILNPEEMIKKDPRAQKLLQEFGVPMTNQNLTVDEARAVLEFLRKAAGEGKKGGS